MLAQAVFGFCTPSQLELYLAGIDLNTSRTFNDQKATHPGAHERHNDEPVEQREGCFFELSGDQSAGNGKERQCHADAS